MGSRDIDQDEKMEQKRRKIVKTDGKVIRFSPAGERFQSVDR